jgi:hypothetical protein
VATEGNNLNNPRFRLEIIIRHALFGAPKPLSINASRTFCGFQNTPPQIH